MRYRRKLVFLCLAFSLVWEAGCTGKAKLYESTQEAVPEEGTQEPVSEEGTQEPVSEESIQNTAEEEETLCVYVCGEVASPGVYELPEDARIHDALTAAGNMTEEAAPSWLNLAEHIKDGQKIEVPSKEQVRLWEETGRTPEEGEGVSSGRKKEDTLVNLNTASEQELQALPGIGEGKAREIVSYREEHGSFRQTEDLMKIPGIKEGVFSKIKDQITV